jgi:hypothetical protein
MADSPDAVAWCMYGAIYRVCGGGEDNKAIYMSVLEAIRASVGMYELSMWNDNHKRTQKEVVLALRNAITAAS